MATDSFPLDIVGFDLDGTLLDTSPDLAAAVNHALALAGRPLLTVDQIRPMIGGGGGEMLRLAFAESGGCSPDAFAVYHRAMLDHYEAHITDGSQPYPGLTDALDALAGQGVMLGVATNKFEARAVKLLRLLGLVDRFACVIGSDTLGPGSAKPSPAMILELIARCGGGSAAFVGDSIYDVAAAKAAEVPVIAVRFGFSQEPVEGLGADAVIDHYDALVPTLRGLGS